MLHAWRKNILWTSLEKFLDPFYTGTTTFKNLFWWNQTGNENHRADLCCKDFLFFDFSKFQNSGIWQRIMHRKLASRFETQLLAWMNRRSHKLFQKMSYRNKLKPAAWSETQTNHKLNFIQKVLKKRCQMLLLNRIFENYQSV